MSFQQVYEPRNLYGRKYKDIGTISCYVWIDSCGQNHLPPLKIKQMQLCIVNGGLIPYQQIGHKHIFRICAEQNNMHLYNIQFSKDRKQSKTVIYHPGCFFLFQSRIHTCVPEVYNCLQAEHTRVHHIRTVLHRRAAGPY